MPSKYGGIDMRTFSSNENESIENKNRIAGFFKQIRILLWKNYILSKRNKIGLNSELLAPICMLLILLIIRIAVSVDYNKEQNFDSKNVLDYFNNSNRDLVLYYPNNTFIESIVNRGMEFIKKKHSWFNPIS
jgi:hypothetical protein